MHQDFLTAVRSESRVLMEAELKPILGERFQATGFPDLGPALYQLHDGTEMLLVESAQSMANRLEAVCWDEVRDDLVEGLRGLPYVKVDLGDYGVTSTWLEFHRLNSPYIWDTQKAETDEAGDGFRKAFRDKIGLGGKKAGDDVPGVLDTKKLAKAVFTYDPNSIIHGVFLEKVSGRLRLIRALSGFVEAKNVFPAESGGVKFDRVFPAKTKLDDVTLDSQSGYTNVPFHRTEFTAEKIIAYFNLDVSLLKSYGLDDVQEDNQSTPALDLLIALSLFKIRRFLDLGLRLRTACDLEVSEGSVNAGRPKGFELPTEELLAATIKEKIAECADKGLFSEPAVQEIKWRPKKKKEKSAEPQKDAAKTTED